jgi:hypothetical protein
MKTAGVPAQKTYSNPRLSASIPEWPCGRHRTTAYFVIEQHPTRGERGVRRTAHPLTGTLSKPKTLTYARLARIVDGSDGRIYILEAHKFGQGISVMQSNMQYQEDVVYPDESRYEAIKALFCLCRRSESGL